MVQVHLFITGIVQGVGYRNFVRYHARKLGLTGWVQNLPDGRVEALVQGDKGRVERLIRQCRKGPVISEVRDVQVFWEEAIEEFSEFTIRKIFER